MVVGNNTTLRHIKNFPTTIFNANLLYVMYKYEYMTLIGNIGLVRVIENSSYRGSSYGGLTVFLCFIIKM
jgi:hypothetical protein